jgi:hypothetical protein
MEGRIQGGNIGKMIVLLQIEIHEAPPPMKSVSTPYPRRDRLTLYFSLICRPAAQGHSYRRV